MRIGICGPGESGKFVASSIISGFTGLRYYESTSEYAAGFVFQAMKKRGYEYPDKKHCWLDRRNHREFWKREILAYNTPDLVRMYREMILEQDIIDGIRALDEFKECRRKGLLDLTIYIHRPGKVEGGCEIKPDHCDIVFFNTGTLEEYQEKLTAFAKSLKF